MSCFKDVDISITNEMLKNFSFFEERTCALSDIMSKYGSDKGWGLTNTFLKNNIYSPNAVCHNYTCFYTELFKNLRNEKIAIFEMGVGVPSCMASWAGSLLGWQEYFPNSEIFSADIDKDYLYNKDKIRSFYVDQENENSINNLWLQLSNKTFDLIIDDGPHTFSSNYLFFTLSFNKLKNGGIYIIEDVNLDFIDKLYADINIFCLDNKIPVSTEKLIIPYHSSFKHPSSQILKMNNLIIIKKI